MEQAIEYNSKEPSNYSTQSSIYLSLKQPLLAIRAIKHAIQLRPRSLPFHQHLASLYIQIGELKGSKSIYSGSINQVNELESLISLSHRLMISHQFEECIPILEKIRCMSPFWRIPFIELVHCNVFLYRSKEAMDLISCQCGWICSLNEDAKLNTGLLDGLKNEIDFDESIVYLSLLVLWQLNRQREIMILYGLCKKHEVNEKLNELLRVCEEFQRLDLEGMDRMTSNDWKGSIEVLNSLHMLLESVEASGVPIGKSVDNAILLNKGLMEQIDGRMMDAKGNE